MLNQLVESKNNTNKNKRLGGFLLTTSISVFSVLTVALIFSLFNHSLAMTNNLDITTLVNPVNLPDEKPVEVIKPNSSPSKNESRLPTREINMARVDEVTNEIPKSISVTPNQQKARPATDFKIGKINTENLTSGDERIERTGNNLETGNSLAVKQPTVEVKNEIPKPPPIPKTETKTEPKPETTSIKTVSGGVVNGKATYLAKPTYSAAARAIRASGQVKIQVTIDEDGKVVSANALNGHPLLQSAALSAAKASTFTPTTLSNQKVKVSGVIVYNFTDR